MNVHPDTLAHVELLFAAARSAGIQRPVVEVRSPKVSGRMTCAGYFDEAGTAAEAIARLDARPGVRAIYATINPVDPALLARASNRIADFAEGATGDAQILRRLWLALDLDPARPAGISSTDEEHGAALTAGEHIRAELGREGWPAPVVIDSGNGAWLLYPIDLPNDDQGKVLVEGALAGLSARFSTTAVKVDTTVGNASRIGKVAGTMARKGDNIPERPHRRARLLEVPSELRAVTAKQLHAIAPPPAPTKKPSPGSTPSSGGSTPRSRSALEREVAGVRNAPDGEKNNTLNRAAFNLGQLVGAGELDRAGVEAALLEAVTAAGAADLGHAAKTIRSGLEAGGRKPRDQPERQAQALADKARPDLKPLPHIALGLREEAVADEVIAALASRDDLYERCGRLARVLLDDDGTPVIRELAPATLREIITATVEVGNHKKEDDGTFTWTPTRPPEWLTKAILARGEWVGIRLLQSVATAPVMVPSGNIVASPGYYAPCGILMVLSAEHPGIATVAPSIADVRAAVAAIDDVLADFPFVAVQDRAAAFAMFFTLVARPAITGSVPMFLVRASVRGSGKGKLVDVSNIATTGRRCRVVALSDDTENDKLLHSLALEGVAAFSYDNIRRPIGGASLERALTNQNYGRRRLGVSESSSPPWRAVVFGTGNGATLTGDMARRVIVCDLKPQEESPEDRQGFRHPNLLGHVERIWPKLNAAALTILRAFHIAGRPGHGRPVLGSYEEWDGLVRAACLWVGVGDPDARKRLREDGDDDREHLRAALEVWHSVFGVDGQTSVDVCRKAGSNSDLAAVLEGILDGEELTPANLGIAISQRRDRKITCEISDGVVQLHFEAAKRSSTGRKWRIAVVRPVSPCEPPVSPPGSLTAATGNGAE